MDSTSAKEMAKYIVMGVDYLPTGKEKRNFVGKVLERYNVVDKDKINLQSELQGVSKNELQGGVRGDLEHQDEQYEPER